MTIELNALINGAIGAFFVNIVMYHLITLHFNKKMKQANKIYDIMRSSFEDYSGAVGVFNQTSKALVEKSQEMLSILQEYGDASDLKAKLTVLKGGKDGKDG